MREAEVAIGESDLAAMGIEDLVSLFREGAIRDFEELACRGDGGVVRVVVESRIDEDDLRANACVDAWERVAGSDEHVYVVEFTAPHLSGDLAGGTDDLLGTCDPELDERGVRMSLVGSQDAIAGAVSEYEASGVSPDLRKLGQYDGTSDPFEDLTDRQREVVRTAYEMGYYEVPREASTEAVAEELDLDASTVAEHLQRAERNLLAHHLE